MNYESNPDHDQRPPNVTPAYIAAGHYSPSPATQPIIIQQGRSGGGLLLGTFAMLGWMAFGLCALFLVAQLLTLSDYFDTSGGITEKHHSGTKFADSKVAIISITGVIMDGEGYARSQIDRVRDDASVKAIVLRVDSPGGTVTGSDYIFHHLNKLRQEKDIPLVVSMGSMAASGGYYVAMAVGDQEKSIFAEPTTTTGSIGVIIPHYDVSGLMARYDVKDDSIASHPRKQMLAMTRPIPEEHRELLQAYVDESFSRFKEIVKLGRPAFRDDSAALDELATGEIFTATKAKESGLVDEIGFLEEAIDRAMELAHLDADNTSVVRYLRPATLFDMSGLMMSNSPRPDLSALLELTSPRAYYLASSMPPLMASYSMLWQDR
ncbi:MAG TPA: signal peptide peptidase SppA [Pirellulaceae bacterium]|nr:signal peptide peptidase SppA [Planctomycetales bacterium]HRX78725.1 signal peptide peptidase SppA [Pirellulaceae bacterium]